MKVSSPYFSGPTAKPAPKAQTHIINDLSSMELKDFLSDHFETSSQFSTTDLSDIGENYWDFMETQSEPLSPLVVNQTQQPGSQTATAQNPFHNNTVALPPGAALPTKQNQQEMSDSQGQQQPTKK